MNITILDQNNSILNHYLNELRDTEIQKDSLRFRKNLERIGEISAYEISKKLSYNKITISTPLGIKHSYKIEKKIVVLSILRAGLSLHQGFINYFDQAEHGFISAYRHYINETDFEIKIEYKAIPDLTNKTIILVDPMLASGHSLVQVAQKLHLEQFSSDVHLAVTIAAPEGIKFVQKNLPNTYNLWIASKDDYLNEHQYIIPGLGDAGDLAFGIKL